MVAAARQANSLKAGIFIACFLLALSGVTLLLGGERHIFERQEVYVTSFSNVGGLVKGAPVRLGGITIGRVAEIGFGDNPYDPTVKVKVLISTDYLDRIREDSVASIETSGLLGDKFLGISAGMSMASQPNLKPGSYIKSAEPADFSGLLTKASQIVSNTEKISQSVSEVMKKLEKDAIQNISDGAKGFANAMNQIEKGKGLAHRIFYSEKDGDEIMTNLKKTADNLEEVTSEVKTGKGLLHALIYDPKGKELVASLTSAAENISTSMSNIGEITKEINEGSGLLHQIIYEDSPDINQKLGDAVTKINDAATALKSASEALANGNGTIGALLVDAQLYDNMVQITDGAQRSYLLKQAIRSAMKEAKTQEKE